MDQVAKAVIGDVVRAAFKVVKQGQEYFSDLDTTTDTVNALTPLVYQMMECNQNLSEKSPEIQKLHDIIHGQQQLVQMCPKSWWGIFSFPYYQNRLRARDNDLKRHMSVNVVAENALDTKKVREDVGKIREILETLMENFGRYHGLQIKGGAPEEPLCVGMEDHLSKLKMELLKDGVSVHVLTGLAGSGKSTLAKKICWDPQVKDKFGINIFFDTFSKTPNVKNIVKTLLEKFGCKVPEFQDDKDAIDQLKKLLRLIGRSPILLVLDDVWENSAALIEKFKIEIPDYKILVTSRFALERFGKPHRLEQLGHDDAVSIFRHFAELKSSSNEPQNDLVDEIVKSCKGSPLALEVIGGSLRNKRLAVWQNMKERLQTRSILDSTDLLCPLQQSLDTVEENFSFSEKECFEDLGLFPEDQRIPVATLIDMWAELHKLKDEGRDAMTIVDDFATRNLVKLVVKGKAAEDENMSYNNHFIMLHDQLRDLAAYQSHQIPFDQKKKYSIELYGDKHPEWWVGQNEQGILGRMLSLVPRLFIGTKQQRVAAQVLSVSTDENFDSDWHDIQAKEAEVLILNLCSSKYSLPHFTDKMGKLKVLIATNYGFHFPELEKFELLGSVPDLKRIRLEKVSVPSLCILKNLQNFSLYMCNTNKVFEESSVKISDALPNLVELSIAYCKDLKKLPDGVSNIITLKKLSITNCHRLKSLPQDIGNLKNLELLRLSFCSLLEEIPKSVGGLNSLRCLDITACVTLAKLPDEIGDLHSLEKLFMEGCSGLLEDLPSSVGELKQLKKVFCDDEGAAYWKRVDEFPNSKIVVSNQNTDLSWLDGARS